MNHNLSIARTDKTFKILKNNETLIGLSSINNLTDDVLSSYLNSFNVTGDDGILYFYNVANNQFEITLTN